MDKYVCPCGYVYDPAVGDPDHGVAPGTPWEQVPEDWECPICGMRKDVFEKEYSFLTEERIGHPILSFLLNGRHKPVFFPFRNQSLSKYIPC